MFHSLFIQPAGDGVCFQLLRTLIHTDHLLWANYSYNPVSFAHAMSVNHVCTVGSKEMQTQGEGPKDTALTEAQAG